MISQNNHNLNLAFPAVVINTDKLQDGVIDVQPIVNYMNPINRATTPFPKLYGISVVFPSTQNSSICFPVSQGDFVQVLVQSVDIQSYVNGEDEPHDPFMLSHGNLANAVAIVGFNPYQYSVFNANNYKNDFDLNDLNIFHNKNTDNECSVSMSKDGEVTIKSPIKVVIDSPNIDAKNANISTMGDVDIMGMSVKQFMLTHTHIDSQGSPTTAPVPKGT